MAEVPYEASPAQFEGPMTRVITGGVWARLEMSRSADLDTADHGSNFTQVTLTKAASLNGYPGTTAS
jgi:hypothetical protein